jgi:Cd(II)/Pb(II)-responsive transcriptional regulator
MRIGELARRADCPVEAVRHYEKEGVLPAPRRSGSNYRDYGASHLERLAFIRRCRALDMSLPEIRALLEAIERPGADCGPVDTLLDEHIGHVAARIADLTELKEELDAIRAHCAGGQPARACGIVATLSRQSRRRVPRRGSHVRGAK